jgi:hypothetical protein
MSQITVLRPTVDEPQASPFVLAQRNELPRRPVIGLVANGKPLATELLDVLVDELRARIRREVLIERIAKPSAGLTMHAGEADSMAARAHMIITGVGD